MAHSSSLVLELQQLATDKKNDVSDLLRKALLVATKLKIHDFRDWINNELHGYGPGAVIPAYRTVRAGLRARNPYHGLIPYIIEDPREADVLLNVQLHESIGSYVHLLENGGNDMLCVPLPPEQVAALMREQDVPLEPVRLIGRNTLAVIIDTVRTTIVEWALRLEAKDILGEGMTFSEDEKKKAATSAEIHITNFQGVLGDITHSTVNQSLQMTVKQGDFSSLDSYLRSHGVSEKDISELERAVRSDPQPVKRDCLGPSVSNWIGTMIAKAASGASQLGIGTAGSLLAQAIWVYYGL